MSTLRLGSTGPEVAELQQKLAQLGFNPVPAGGTYDAATRQAVEEFQRSDGLKPDGVAGPRTALALGMSSEPEIPRIIPGVTLNAVARMFPVTPLQNMRAHLPAVLQALVAPQLTDKKMVLMALATIRAETEAFLPISEAQSEFNTSAGGHPFDRYDHRGDLGNQGPPDGERFRGRGFVQLTGRANYAEHGAAIGLGNQLVEQPELANDSEIAARLLASFLGSKERPLRDALAAGDLARARKLVNGGSHGLDRFTDAYRTGDKLLPEAAAV